MVRSRRISFYFSVMAVLVLAACGDDDGGGRHGGSASPEQAATNSVDSAVRVQALADSPADQTALGSVTEMYAHMQTLHSASVQASAQQQAAASKSAGAGLVTAAYAQFSADCVSTVGDVSTYTNCELADTSTSGTVTTSGESIAIDLTLEVDPEAYRQTGEASGGAMTIDSVSVREHGTLNFAGGGLVGTMQFAIDTTVTTNLPGVPGGGQTVTQTVDLTGAFDLVLTDGCATGGTLTVTGPSVMPGAGESQTVATFGPACGDVSVD